MHKEQSIDFDHGALMDVVALTQALVHIPSSQPSGDTQAIIDFLARLLEANGCASQIFTPPDKPVARSLIASVGQGDPVIVLHSHVDTVTVGVNEANEWIVDPFEAAIRDGRLYGKGSADDKASVAAMTLAFLRIARRLASQPEPSQGTIVLALVADEETGGRLGTRWLAEQGHLPVADFIIVGEPTRNQVAIAHKGAVRATLRAVGRSAHAGNPANGISAIMAMVRGLLALEQYHQSVLTHVHPLVGSAACTIGMIQGGMSTNTVPDFCWATIDRRTLPQEKLEVVQDELVQLIAQTNVAPAQLTLTDFLFSRGYSSTCSGPLGQRLLDSIQQVTGQPSPLVGFPAGSDAKHLVSLTRGEMVVFGPGEIEVCHAANEYVELAQLRATQAILDSFLDSCLT